MSHFFFLVCLEMITDYEPDLIITKEGEIRITKRKLFLLITR